jgi:hypothetical protein
MKQFYLASLAGLFSIGCVDMVKDTGGGGNDGSADAMEVSVTWGGSSVDLSIANGDAAGDYWFGLAETEGSSDPWTGEDCYEGYTLGDGSVLSYCHPSSSTGASLAYGGGTSDLSEGSETVFGSADFDGSVTYFLEDANSGACWVWGATPSYYDGLGCDVIE